VTWRGWRAAIVVPLLICSLVRGLPVAAGPQDAPDTRARLFQMRVDRAVEVLMGDPKQALRLTDTAGRLVDAREPRRSEQLATLAWLRADAMLFLNEPAEAEPSLHRARALARRLPASKLTGDIRATSGWLAAMKGDVATALFENQQAYATFRQIGDQRSQARALLFIASLYGDANDHAATIRYSQRALAARPNDPVIRLTVANNLAQAFKDEGRLADAQKQLRTALATAAEIKRPGLAAHLHRNLARVQLLSGDIAGADRSIAQALRAARDGGSDEAPALWATRAQAALQHGRLGEAKALIGRSFDGIDPDTTPVAFRENHQTAYDIYRRSGDEALALRHLAALKRLDDQAVKLATSASAALMGARFDFAQQELTIANLQRDELQRRVAYEQAQARTERVIFAGVAAATLVIIALLAVGLFTIRRSRNQVARANTDLERTNDALGKALAAKTEFLATTSHEIRTPLNGILGMTQVMLADEALQPAVRDRIGVVHGAGVTMRALVDDILDVAKMENGKLTLEAVPFDLCRTLSDVCRLWEEQARAKGLGFRLDLSGCPETVVGDAARLRQIVFNLLSNALKFTEAGAIHVTGAVRTGDVPRLAVTVRDTGVGIPSDKLDAIFESFRQADAGTTRRFGGTGLGLTICRNLARAMGGDVTVESRTGEGATFTLELPLVEGERPGAPAVARAALVVDRNPITRAMFATLLGPRLGEVAGVATLAEASERIAAGAVSALLVDESAVGGDLEALRALAGAATHAGVTPVLLATVPDAAARARLTATGIARLVAKPVTRAALLAVFAEPPSTVDRTLVSRAA
jgi:signal transduction histidine kinase